MASNTREEKRLIKLALERPEVRAFVIIVGALMELPSDRARERVLRFVADKLDEDDDAAGRSS